MIRAMSQPLSVRDARRSVAIEISTASLADLEEWTAMRTQIWPDMSVPEQGVELTDLLS